MCTRDRAIAWVALVGLHALGLWGLTRTSHPRNEGHSTDEVALIVHFVQASHGAAARSSRQPARRKRVVAPPSRHSGSVAVTPEVVTVAPVRSATTASFLAQVRDPLATGGSTPSVDALADRQVRLPGRDANHFRMTRNVSPEQVVVGVGALLFWPPGYEADPCPRNRRNLANLATGGDSQRLRMELEFERKHCRP